MIDDSRVKTLTLDLVMHSDGAVTPTGLVSKLKIEQGLEGKVAKQMIRELIESGELEYSDQNGRTCIDLSYKRPVRISPHVILKPPEMSCDGKKNDIVINLRRATSFGWGNHPTTQLSIQALDWVLFGKNEEMHGCAALDIGTGSGVLALVAARLGMGHVYACDIDPVSLNEARENVVLNKLEDSVYVVEKPDFEMGYQVIIANLRYPTLLDLYPEIEKMVNDKGYVVLSGIKVEEKKIVEDLYGIAGVFTEIWSRDKNGWCGLVFRKKDKKIHRSYSM